MRGRGRADEFVPGAGADEIVGGTGRDAVEWFQERFRIEVDVPRGLARTQTGTNRFLSIEAYILTPYADSFVGGSDAERIRGGDGPDSIAAGADKVL